MDCYADSRLYNTCAICARVELPVGLSRPLLPEMIPAETKVSIAIFA